MGNFFTDVILADLRVNSNLRCSDTALLEPVTGAAVQAIIGDAANLGITLMVWETYRSPWRQQELFEQGATKLRAVGVHRFGLAADLVKSINNSPSWKGDFTFLYTLCEKHGLIWGGNWGQPGVKHNFIDSCHVQRCTKRDEPALFANTWYPDENYNPTANTVAVAASSGQ